MQVPLGPAVLLVDGYNILFDWYKKDREKNPENDLEFYRDKLVDELEVMWQRDRRVVVAFDAMRGSSCSLNR